LIPCGIAFPKATIERTALSSTSNWYDKVLEHHNDERGGEEFAPGSTHYWVARQNLRLPDGTEKGAPFNVLAIELEESPRPSSCEPKSGVLNVPLNHFDSSGWAEDVEETLN